MFLDEVHYAKDDPSKVVVAAGAVVEPEDYAGGTAAPAGEDRVGIDRLAEAEGDRVAGLRQAAGRADVGGLDVGAARAVVKAALARSAASIGAPLTPDDVAIARADDAAQRLDSMLETMRRDGTSRRSRVESSCRVITREPGTGPRPMEGLRGPACSSCDCRHLGSR